MDIDENDGRLRGVFIKDTAVISNAGNMHGVAAESHQCYWHVKGYLLYSLYSTILA